MVQPVDPMLSNTRHNMPRRKYSYLHSRDHRDQHHAGNRKELRQGHSQPHVFIINTLQKNIRGCNILYKLPCLYTAPHREKHQQTCAHSYKTSTKLKKNLKNSYSSVRHHISLQLSITSNTHPNRKHNSIKIANLQKCNNN